MVKMHNCNVYRASTNRCTYDHNTHTADRMQADKKISVKQTA